MLGLVALYHIQMKATEKKIANKRSIESRCIFSEEERKMSKASLPWYRNLTVYSVMHLKLKHDLTAFFILLSTECSKYISVSFFFLFFCCFFLSKMLV